MESQLRTIRLYGKLGRKFGRIHKFSVANVKEAIQAMCMVLPGFERDLMTSRDRGITYAIFLDKRNINQEQLEEPTGKSDIRIAPVLSGAKQAGLFQTIAGAVLVVIGAALNIVGGYAIGVPIMQFGAAMMLGGVIQMLSPQQKGLSAKDNPDNGASYNFNGPVNTSAQGNPVPLLYGRMICGSAVISAGILADDKV
ncbi:MAG: tail assembly protein [Collimonas pratensis]|uniref:tail assembly protein n=1 Tax=Collimonas pratensis TaxID=279113 RepID=UPI003C78326D